MVTNNEIDDTSDPHTIELQYQSIVEQGDYLPQRVLIEIGSRSLMEPSESRPIESIIGSVFREQKFAIKTILCFGSHPNKNIFGKNISSTRRIFETQR